MQGRFTISGIEHLIRLLNTHPQLMGLSSLAPIQDLANKAKRAVAMSGCGCSAGPIYGANRHVFENALANMQNGDHLIIKNILKVNELCYSVKDATGRSKLVCV